METDPIGAATASYRVHRGGSFGIAASSARAAARDGGLPAYLYYTLGLRLARTAP
jgi:formylglycine-generating enzyme required for sulfatase activity